MRPGGWGHDGTSTLRGRGEPAHPHQDTGRKKVHLQAEMWPSQEARLAATLLLGFWPPGLRETQSCCVRPPVVSGGRTSRLRRSVTVKFTGPLG